MAARFAISALSQFLAEKLFSFGQAVSGSLVAKRRNTADRLAHPISETAVGFRRNVRSRATRPQRQPKGGYDVGTNSTLLGREHRGRFNSVTRRIRRGPPP